MAKQRLKMTGCARFLIALIIIVPLAYFGAKLIRGGDGIPVIDDFLSSVFEGDNSENKPSDRTIHSDDLQKTIDDQAAEIRRLERALDDCRTGRAE